MTSIFIDDDIVERAEKNLLLISQCSNLISEISYHMQQFPSSPFFLSIDNSIEIMTKVWIEGYYSMNEQISSADKFSVSDLVFVTLCYMHISSKPELRECGKVDQNINVVLDILRFMGSQHTPETISTWPESTDIERLYNSVAWIVVSTISSPCTVASLTSPVVHTGTLADKVKLVQRYAEAPKNSEGKYIREIQLGDFWSQLEPSSIFLMQAARITHGLMLEDYILSLFPLDEIIPIIDCRLFDQLDKWLSAACTIDSSDDFAQTFRDMVFDMLCPLNSRANTRSRKQGGASGDVVPLTLLQFELGFDVAEKLNNILSVRVRNIGFERDHPFYDSLLLHMFGHVMLHELRIEFNKLFIVHSINLLKELYKIRQTIKFGRNREPLILRIKRSYYVHYICCETNKGRLIKCKNTQEACLFWLYSLLKHNEGQLISGHCLVDWSKNFLEIKLNT